MTTKTLRRGSLGAAATTLLGVLLAVAPSSASAAPVGLAAEFASAAHEFGVPEPILLAVSYNMTNWQPSAAPNEAGGVGPMGLISEVGSAESGKGSQAHTATVRSTTSPLVTRAADALHTSAAAVLTDPAQNIRAAAAVLAADAKSAGGTLPTDTSAWYPALVRYAQDSGTSSSAAGSQAFADDVFRTLRTGVAAKAGSPLSLPADRSIPVTPKRANASTPTANCPSDLDCRFVPAAYDWSSADHSDPNNYGNYDPADRPADGDGIQYIVIHDTETSYDNAIAVFQNPGWFASANYVIRASDGQVTQMVRNQDVSWDVNNWTMNQHSISIEHEGVAAQGSSYTPQEYQASAKLVRYLAAEYNIPLDRQHIIGHDEVPGELTASQAKQHWDPGPFWNWQHYMGLLDAPAQAARVSVGSVVTVNPDFASNQPPVTTCDSSGTCTPLPAQGANFVYLRTGPSATAPLIGDPLLHPGGGPGTMQASDWSDKAVSGRQYVVAGQQGDWTAIWYDGQKAWFSNPHGVNTLPACAATVHAPAGVSTVNLYGRAFPQASEYPASIPFDQGWAPTPLTGWTLPAGQSYTVLGTEQASNYFARFDPAGVAGNHTLVTGADQYLLIDFNHRYVMVKASDVVQTPAS
ncbi:N-acetylmuramoyl-L-alanine amidase [Kutzneria buriramensis]|uniref:N-acetylmuramoyl-L-alanine amidase n=1 Tax=Kutzneria buriramensis TaxID=1045776 RepID=UPI001FE2DAA7|nr:peptidoglycan recognition family protein [Kutzneria buriramensis]